MITRHEVLLLLLTCLLLGLAGCGRKVDEDTIGGLMDAENDAVLEEGVTIDAEDASPEISAKIPDRYPHELCPIYEPSEVSVAIESEDEEFIGYTVGLLTKDDIEIVKKFYLDHNPQSRSDMGLMAVYVFEAENGDDYASVTVMENQDEADKEFKTSITISVGLSK